MQENITSPRMEMLKLRLQQGDPQAEMRFWQEIKVKGGPLVEPTTDPKRVLVTFLYHGSSTVHSVVLYSQLTVGRDPSINKLSHLANTDVWFKTYGLPSDMRFSYSFVPDPTDKSFTGDTSLQFADALNPKAAPDVAYMGHSLLELPAAPPQTWITPRPSVPTGRLQGIAIASKVLGAERQAWIYTPASYDGERKESYPLLICFDGLGYGSADYVPVPTILDNLVAEKKIAPTLLLLVGQAPQAQRNIELSNNPAFLRFVTDELLPQVRAKWHATNDPTLTVVCGSSAGGLAGAYFAFMRPDIFGNVLSQSGALWPGKERNSPDHEWLTQQFRDSPRSGIRFVLQVGILEITSTPLNGPSILMANRHFRDVLISKGYEVHYNEIAGGHEPVNWRGGIAEGLMQLMPFK